MRYAMCRQRIRQGYGAALLFWCATLHCDPYSACDDPGYRKTLQACRPQTSADTLPTRVSLRDLQTPQWKLSVKLDGLRNWHRLRLDFLAGPPAMLTDEEIKGCDEKAQQASATAQAAKSIDLLVIGTQAAVLGQRYLRLRDCVSGFELSQPVRVYDPPRFNSAVTVTDKNPGAGVTVQKYIGVSLGKDSIFAHEDILAPTQLRRLAELDTSGVPKGVSTTGQDSYLQVNPERGVAVSQGAGLFARLPALGMKDDLRFVNFKNDMMEPLGHGMPSLPSGTSLLAADAESDRVALLEGGRLTVKKADRSAREISSAALASCDVSGVNPMALAVALGHSGGLPGSPVLDMATAVLLGKKDSKLSVSVCYAQAQASPDETKKAQDAAAKCFQDALIANAGELTAQLSLADLDGDGLLDLLVAPADASKPLVYVPAQDGATGCTAVALPDLKQPMDSPVTGVAAGLANGVMLNGRGLPSVVIATSQDLRRFDRRAP